MSKGGTQVADFSKGKIREINPTIFAPPPAKPRKSHKMGHVKEGVHKLQIFVKEKHKEIVQKSWPPPKINVENRIQTSGS